MESISHGNNILFTLWQATKVIRYGLHVYFITFVQMYILLPFKWVELNCFIPVAK